MKLRVLVPLLLACSSVFAADVLTGVRSVYVTGDLRARHDITRALKALPQVRVVSRESDADAVLGLRFAGTLGGPASFTVPAAPPTVLVGVGNRIEEQAAPSQYQVPAHSFSPGYMIRRSEGVVRLRNGAETVLFEGIDSPMSPGQFASRFITAWRDANR